MLSHNVVSRTENGKGRSFVISFDDLIIFVLFSILLEKQIKGEVVLWVW